MAATRQEIFDKLVVDLVCQGKPSTRIDSYGYERCSYRGENGTKCAVGMLIPDHIYEPQMEGYGIGDLVDARPELMNIHEFNTLGIYLLKDVQTAHDICTSKKDNNPPFVDTFLMEMRSVATLHDLEWHFKVFT